MRSFLEELDRWGCDSRPALTRLRENQAAYYQAVMAFADDSVMDEIGSAVRAGSKETWMLQARDVTERAAELGLSPVWQETYPLAHGCDNPEAQYAALRRCLRQLKEILARY